MSSFDIEQLLEPVGPDDPCGPDLEYDPDFLEMSRLGEPVPEREMGAIKEEAREPDWRGLKSKCLDLAKRTKHLRVAVYLTQAALKTEGFEGFVTGLGYVRGLLERYWDGVHPKLDPEDANDPTMRVNILAELISADSFLRYIKEVPIVESARVGRFSLRDVLVAQGQLPAPEGKEPPTNEIIHAAFSDAGVDAVRAKDSAIEAAIASVKGIEAAVTSSAGAGRAASLAPLVQGLQAVRAPIAQWMIESGAAEPAASPDGGGGAPGAPVQRVAGEITTRDDAIRMMGKIAEFIRKSEPSSPVPILLERAQKLVGKDFISILRNVAPDGLDQIERLKGPQDE